MKKSKLIQLVLVAAAITSCNSHKDQHERKVYMRSDTTAGYSHMHGFGYGMMYYAFRPYGLYHSGGYNRVGYYSSSINRSSNYGANPVKGMVSRGGFGSSVFHVSS